MIFRFYNEVSRESIARLSNDDDSNENVAKNMNLLPFKLFRVYLDLPYFSNVSHFSWI